MPNQFLSDEFGDIEDYFVTDYWLIDNFVGDTILTWGRSNEGQLGNNPSGTNWKQVACGDFHTAAVKTDGSLWLWGAGGDGRLGTNDTTQRNTPVTTFTGGNTWKQVACGRFHTAAVKTDGSLWTWGSNSGNSSGALGDNTTTNRNIPVTTFAGGTNWKSVACSGYHTAAIKTDGSLWTWGNNNNGQLGTNNTTTRSTPVTTFAGGNDWKSVAGGRDFTAAVKTDGSLWLWGAGGDGRLGTNNTTQQNVPVTTFAGGTNWKSVDCGGRFTAAIKTDGSLWTWGWNAYYGQLGTNNLISRSTPVTTFAGGTNWKSVACGGEFAAAVKTDGSLWTWGRNVNGALGDNTTTDRSTPVTTSFGGNNWKSASGGEFHTAAVKSGLNVDLS